MVVALTMKANLYALRIISFGIVFALSIAQIPIVSIQGMSRDSYYHSQGYGDSYHHSQGYASFGLGVAIASTIISGAGFLPNLVVQPWSPSLLVDGLLTATFVTLWLLAAVFGIRAHMPAFAVIAFILLAILTFYLVVLLARVMEALRQGWPAIVWLRPVHHLEEGMIKLAPVGGVSRSLSVMGVATQTGRSGRSPPATAPSIFNAESV